MRYEIQDEVPLARGLKKVVIRFTPPDKLDFIEFPVIASQFANWRGNLLDRRTIFIVEFQKTA